MYPHLVLYVIRKSVPPVGRYSPFLCFHIVWLKIGVPFGCPNCAVEYSLWFITMQVLSLGVGTLGGIVFALFWRIESIIWAQLFGDCIFKNKGETKSRFLPSVSRMGAAC